MCNFRPKLAVLCAWVVVFNFRLHAAAASSVVVRIGHGSSHAVKDFHVCLPSPRKKLGRPTTNKGARHPRSRSGLGSLYGSQPIPALLAYSGGSSVTANGVLGSAVAMLRIGSDVVFVIARLASADTALSSRRSEWTGLLLGLRMHASSSRNLFGLFVSHPTSRGARTQRARTISDDRATFNDVKARRLGFK